MKRIAYLLLSMVFVLAAACGGDTDGDSGASLKPESDGKDPGKKADQWNAANNPTGFEISFEYNYDKLMEFQTGEAEQTPWPSDYWSYYEDSINVRYAGEGTLSPVEKYDVAFNNWTPNMELKPMDVSADCEDGLIKDKHDEYYAQLGPAAKWQHENKGNYKARNGIDDDGDGKTDECDDDYDGIETWWGLCHAWVPAAILEAEPQHSVTVNGVEFSVSDIKALLIASYDRSSAHMLGGRCNAKEVERDDQGRALLAECRDTNAGSFYVVITNMLGKMKRAFAEDRTAGYQVWNQPILAYRILKEEELTEEQAMEKLEHPGKKFHEVFDSPEAVTWRYVKMDVDYITESSADEDGPLAGNISTYTRTDHYEMVLEIDGDGNVVGGEWMNYSMSTHPDFLWLPIRAYYGNPSMPLAQVKTLLELSLKPEVEEPAEENIKTFGGPTDIAIPDNDATGISYSTNVNETVTVGSLKVTVEIEHTYIGDLLVVLEKDGTSVTLHDRAGGGNANINETYSVHEWDGASAEGQWTLHISDHAGVDTGALKNFQLHVSDSAAAPAETKTFSVDPEMDIPDNDPTGVESVVSITDEGIVRAMDVTVSISHTYIGDLIVKLHNGSQEQTLHNREGGSADDLLKSYKVPSWNGAPIKGDWKLTVTDNAGQDLGTLHTWEIEAELE